MGPLGVHSEDTSQKWYIRERTAVMHFKTSITQWGTRNTVIERLSPPTVLLVNLMVVARDELILVQRISALW